MPSKIRILMADDSVTVRRMLSDTLSVDPELEVCDIARDGQEAVAKFPLMKPDVVVLDVEMPVMDGIEAVIAIRRIDPRVPIVMFSSLTMKGGQATLDALTFGATDYVTKPTQSHDMQEAIGHIRRELIPKIKHLGQRQRDARMAKTLSGSSITLQRGVPGAPSPRETLATGLSALSMSAERFDVITVGVSTGGPNALTEMLKPLSRDFAIPILIAQHMPALFTTLLAERLSQVTALKVREATDGTLLEPGQVWIAPGDQHLVVEKQGFHSILRLNREPLENSCRPSVDVLFRSVAAAYRERTLAIVLTGMGCDGKKGCELIRQYGGKVIAQDEATSVVWGMPGAVTKAGLAHCVLPLPEISKQLTRLQQPGRLMATARH